MTTRQKMAIHLTSESKYWRRKDMEDTRYAQASSQISKLQCHASMTGCYSIRPTVKKTTSDVPTMITQVCDLYFVRCGLYAGGL
jgi:hypothetical protein